MNVVKARSVLARVANPTNVRTCYSGAPVNLDSTSGG